MRDLLLTAIVLGAIPFALRNPFYGLLLWVWLGIMNPHRLAYGFAYDQSWSLLAAAVFFFGILLNVKKLYPFPKNAVTATMILFILWIGVSPFFSFHPEYEFSLWSRAFKIQMMVLIGFLVVRERHHLNLLTTFLALSIGFYGIKGGIFTIASGGSFRVWGPEGSFIEDNNSLALAVIMVIPLFRYIQLEYDNKWIKRGCIAAMLLCVASALGSQSRGALLAIIGMVFFLWAKSPGKAKLGLLLLLATPALILMMPESWFERMGTISNYQEDASATGRINAWWTAWNVAVDRFPIGAGFFMYEPDVFSRYAPNPLAIHAAHSIYFQVLGEHGFIGLALFFTIFTLAWRRGSRVIKSAKSDLTLAWAGNLAGMCQVALVGYAAGGAFLSLTYFDLPYYIVLILVVLEVHVKKQLADITSTNSSQTPAVAKLKTHSAGKSPPSSTVYHGGARR